MQSFKRTFATLAAVLALGMASGLAQAAPPPTQVDVPVLLAQAKAESPKQGVRIPPPPATITNTFGFPQEHAALLAYLDKGDLTAEQWRVLPQMVTIYEGTKAQLVPIGGWTSAAEATLLAMKTALAKGKATGKVT